MQTADITIKESDLQVFRGPWNCYVSDHPREGAFTSLKYLYSDLSDIRRYYIRLGFHLDEFSRLEYYRDFGFCTLEDFTEKNLGMDKSAVSRCINVYRTFNASNVIIHDNGLKKKGSAMELAEEWKDYSYTQLCEMLPLNPEQRKDINPDMTVKQIREYKKELKSGRKIVPVASTQLNPFNLKLYDNSIGIVRQNAVRNCMPINDNVTLTVFDRDGKFVYGNIVCQLICKKDGRYYFRLNQSTETKNKEYACAYSFMVYVSCFLSGSGLYCSSPVSM